MSTNYFQNTDDPYADAIAQAFLDMFGDTVRRDVFGGNWAKNEHSRAPYMDAWRLGETGITLYASPTLTHCCVEISGRGCETLIEKETLGVVLGLCKERVTRIDIACDIETEVTPPDFVEQKSHVRMRTSGHYTSSTGETCYVGSQKSDRFCRVYRYNPPHPRCNLLRIEYVFRRDQAKTVANACATEGTDAVSRAAYLAFGFSHVVGIQEGGKHANITVISDNHKGGNTVFWLVDTVAPCFQKLVRNGVIKDPDAFLLRYFLSET